MLHSKLCSPPQSVDMPRSRHWLRKSGIKQGKKTQSRAIWDNVPKDSEFQESFKSWTTEICHSLLSCINYQQEQIRQVAFQVLPIRRATRWDLEQCCAINSNQTLLQKQLLYCYWKSSIWPQAWNGIENRATLFNLGSYDYVLRPGILSSNKPIASWM